MTPIEEDIARRMYTAQVAAVTALDDLEKSGALTEEMRIKLSRVVDAAHDVESLLRGPMAHENHQKVRKPMKCCEIAIRRAAKECADVFMMTGHVAEEQIQIAHLVLRVAYPNEAEARRIAEEIVRGSEVIARLGDGRIPSLDKYAVLVKPWGIYVKEWDLFVDQGGLRDSWGREWVVVKASSIEDARDLAKNAPPGSHESAQK